MSAKTGIEWTGITWNVTTGCNAISPGCRFCYAKALVDGRLRHHPRYVGGFGCVRFHEDRLQDPLGWRSPARIFVNSMSDLYHERLSFEIIQSIFDVMARASWHQFQVLTKRSERLRELGPSLYWPRNVWQGVSVENQDYTHRIDDLRAVAAKVKFLSLEPLLGPLPNLDLSGIHWVIAGGESGPHARPNDLDWVRDIRDQCVAAGVPFFFKQVGGKNKKKAGKLLDGRTWDEFPAGAA